MAGRINFFKLSKKIHILSSMIMFSFLLMYFFSGVMMVHRDSFKIPEQNQSIDTLVIERFEEENPNKFTDIIEAEFHPRGRLNFKEDWKKNWVYNYEFLGESYNFTLLASRDTLVVSKLQQERTFFTLLHSMHDLRGFKGGWPFTLWAIMYDISCMAMIIFAVTGIIIWSRIRKKYKYGLWFLISGLLIPITFIILYLYA